MYTTTLDVFNLVVECVVVTAEQMDMPVCVDVVLDVMLIMEENVRAVCICVFPFIKKRNTEYGNHDQRD